MISDGLRPLRRSRIFTFIRCALACCAVLAMASGPGLGIIPSALAQEPKIDNPRAIPSTVQPGAIEAQYEVTLTPDLSGAPAVMSPYEPAQPENAGDIRFTLTEIAVEGGGALPASAIEAEYSSLLGANVSLAQIFGVARAVTARYVDAGYPLSLAYVPVQEIEGGVVRLRIIEGYIGEIDIVGAPANAASRLRAHGEKLMAERPLTQSSLERYLLLANQTPGLSVTGVLQKAENDDGGVKMTLSAEQKRFDIAAGVNNRASTAVGREQFYARAGFNNLLTGSDRLQFAAVQSFDLDELTYFSAGYTTILNAEGLVLGLSATRSEAAPGIPFLRDLGFETTGWTAGASLAYPLALRRGESLTLSAKGRWKEFRSAFEIAPNTEDQLWTSAFGVAYVHQGPVHGKNAIAIEMTRGWDILGATRAGDPLASRAGAGGEFLALSLDASRSQKVTDWSTLLLSLKGQTTNNPLLSSEQCGFGGAGIGRGYDPFSISGDRCLIGLVEFQTRPDFLNFGEVSARPYVSFDAGAVRQIGPLAAGEDRAASLYSFAAGARMTITKHVSAGVEGAIPLRRQSPGSDKDMRFFFSLEARY